MIFEQSLMERKRKMKKGAVRRREGRGVPGAAGAKVLVWECRGRIFWDQRGGPRSRGRARRPAEQGQSGQGERSGQWEDRAKEAGVV